jgi:hypothetical protein
MSHDVSYDRLSLQQFTFTIYREIYSRKLSRRMRRIRKMFILCDQAESYWSKVSNAQFAEKSRTVTLANYDIAMLYMMFLLVTLLMKYRKIVGRPRRRSHRRVWVRSYLRKRGVQLVLRIAIPRDPESRTFSQSRNPAIEWLQSRDFGIDNLVLFYIMITVSSSILSTANYT